MMLRKGQPTTKLHDRTQERLSQDEIEHIGL
jgi:hypothetical protein